MAAQSLHGIKLVVSDAHGSLRPALDSRLTAYGGAVAAVPFRPMKNALACGPNAEMRAEIVADLRTVFDAPDRHEAERPLDLAVGRYRASASKAGRLTGGERAGRLAVFALPWSHRQKLRTSDMLERLNEKLKQRTRMAGLFPNDASLQRLVRAEPMEVSGDWKRTEKYLTMGSA